MSLAEGVSRSIRYKFYASGAMTANAQAVSATDLDGSSGGQILRRVASTLNLKKDTYQSNEVRTDRQIQDFRHGVKKVDGNVSGELSPGTWFDFLEAACRGTRAVAIALTESDLTSATFDSGASTVVFASGNPVTLGLRIGHVVRFTNLATGGNNSTNFMITGFSGGSNRTVNISPAPITETADTAFNVTTVGKSIYVPSSSFVARKAGVELYSSDIDISQLYTECRVSGFNMQLPATGMGTIDVSLMGRDMEVASGGSAPFFVAPTAETTTGCIAAVNGLLRLGGTTVGVITGINVQMDLNGSSDAVVGQNFVPEIFLGRANVTGQMTAFLQDATMINYFKNETEVSVLLYLTTSSAGAADFITVYLPRVKVGGAEVATTGEGGQVVTMPFQGLKADGTVAGDNATTIFINDSQAA